MDSKGSEGGCKRIGATTVASTKEGGAPVAAARARGGRAAAARGAGCGACHGCRCADSGHPRAGG
eukprot:11157872-Lingulodinium_polyedra.AAC.1